LLFVAPQDQYLQQRMSGYSQQQGPSAYNTSPPYDRTPTEGYAPRIHNANMAEYNTSKLKRQVAVLRTLNGEN